MLTTAELRTAWAPPCDEARLTVVALVQGVRVRCKEHIVTAVKALGRVLEAHRYDVRSADTGGYNGRGPYPGSRTISGACIVIPKER